MNPTRALTALLLGLSILPACSDQPAGPDDPSATPRSGSTYRFHRYDADTSGAALPGTGDTAVTTLAATNLQYAGETAVHLFVGGNGNDTVARLRYDGSGDVRFFLGFAGATSAGWVSLPVASKSSSERSLRDTVIDFGDGTTGRNRVTLDVSHLSSERVTVGSDTLQTEKVRLRIIDVNPISAELDLIDTTTHTFWYAPSIGYFARQETARSRQEPFYTYVYPTAVRVLTSYVRK